MKHLIVGLLLADEVRGGQQGCRRENSGALLVSKPRLLVVMLSN
jgi:hypothetical protein